MPDPARGPGALVEVEHADLVRALSRDEQRAVVHEVVAGPVDAGVGEREGSTRSPDPRTRSAAIVLLPRTPAYRVSPSRERLSSDG